MKVRSDVLRVYQSIHIWTGIIAGIVLFIGFYAGSLTMFKGAIDAWSMPPSVALPQVSSDRLDELVSQALAQDDKAKNGFSLHLNDEHQSPMTWYPVSYTHLRAHETDSYLVCRLLLEKNFFNDTATTEIYTILFVGSVRCV